jgi:hypothetical protein
MSKNHKTNQNDFSFQEQDYALHSLLDDFFDRFGDNLEYLNYLDDDELTQELNQITEIVLQAQNSDPYPRAKTLPHSTTKMPYAQTLDTEDFNAVINNINKSYKDSYFENITETLLEPPSKKAKITPINSIDTLTDSEFEAFLQENPNFFDGFEERQDNIHTIEMQQFHEETQRLRERLYAL